MLIIFIDEFLKAKISFFAQIKKLIDEAKRYLAKLNKKNSYQDACNQVLAAELSK